MNELINLIERNDNIYSLGSLNKINNIIENKLRNQIIYSKKKIEFLIAILKVNFKCWVNESQKINKIKAEAGLKISNDD